MVDMKMDSETVMAAEIKSEAPVCADVRVDTIRKHVEDLVAIPYRAAGSPNGTRGAHYNRDALIAAGVRDAAVQSLPAIVSFPEHADLRVESPQARAIQATTLGHSLQTAVGGLRGDLVYVGPGGFDDYAGKDVRGKIILTELSYAPGRHEKQRIAALKGAIGAVMMNWGPADNEALPYGSVKPAWGNPTPDTIRTQMPTLPCVGISRAAGLQLKAQCEQGTVQVWFHTHVENGWRDVEITVGRLSPAASSPEADDFLLVGGHQDGWFGEAATDNAAGNACMVELARAFHGYRDRLRRGITFGLWTAHETGTMAGSTWFCDQNWDHLRAHCVAYLQIDQPGCIGTTQWSTKSNSELRAFHTAIEQRMLDKPLKWKPSTKTGDASFFGIGIPMFAAEGAYTDAELKATANASYGWWHHTLDNRIDKLDWTLMGEHIRLYAAYIWELCTAPVLPFRFVPVAALLHERLSALGAAGAGVGVDALATMAQDLIREAQRLDDVAQREAARFSKKQGSDSAALRLNRCLKRLSRLLVPLQSTACGVYEQDPYGFTPQSTVIPCLYDVPRLAATAEGEERWLLETQLRRARNRVADGLHDAQDLIRDTLHDLQ
ncbi:M28 family peptidase [Reyranella sp. CPCC 100927]|nr:M28 family peptidase [Reyranella sp. CPCC 100927]